MLAMMRSNTDVFAHTEPKCAKQVRLFWLQPIVTQLNNTRPGSQQALRSFSEVFIEAVERRSI